MTKLGKYMNIQVMGRDPLIRDSLPETRMFTSDGFAAMIRRYGTVIVKPNFGTGGAGVVKVSLLPGGKYATHYGTSKRSFPNERAVLAYLRGLTAGTSYVVQRYISLAKLNGQPMDLRVMVQRKDGVPWTVTGKLAKVAGPNRIITNVARSGGYVLPSEQALARTFSTSQSHAILAKMDSVCLRAAKQIGIAYGRRTLGFDMGVDRRGKVWVIEANPKPAIAFFKRLKNGSYYRKILDMAPSTSYGRHFTGRFHPKPPKPSVKRRRVFVEKTR